MNIWMVYTLLALSTH